MREFRQSFPAVELHWQSSEAKGMFSECYATFHNKHEVAYLPIEMLDSSVKQREKVRNTVGGHHVPDNMPLKLVECIGAHFLKMLVHGGYKHGLINDNI